MDIEKAEREAFSNEVSEKLFELNEFLLDFENNPDDIELLNKLFRTAHTIKGNAGFVGLHNMVSLAHSIENLFSLIRDHKARINQQLMDSLLEAYDVFQTILEAFHNEDDNADKIDTSVLAKQIEADTAAASSEEEQKSNNSNVSTNDLVSETTQLKDGDILIAIKLKENTPLPGMRAYLLRTKLVKSAEIVDEKPDSKTYDDDDFAGQLNFSVNSKKTIPVKENTSKQAAKKNNISKKEFGKKISEEIARKSNPPKKSKTVPTLKQENTDMLRVPVKKIDSILNLVGELLSANSAYLALTSEFRSLHGKKGLFGYFRENSEDMSRIVADLQERVMMIRMIPVGSVFSRFRRLVRDYNSHNPEKSIELIINGESTEIDKRQIDSIYEPLLHLVRNSMDHGIETKEVRIKRGKDPLGKVTLNAHQSGNHIFIEISDDGGGLDIAKIKSKAIQSGLVSENDLRNYSSNEILDLIFQPGFSTAAKVSDISGRGVGMDVVRRNIESLNGLVNIETTPGMGSKFIIKIPLSMAIVTALKIKVKGHLFAIPITAILETIKITEDEIQTIDKMETIQVRGAFISLLRMRKEIGLGEENVFEEKVKKTSLVLKKPVIIVQYYQSRIGILVDDLLGYEDMVVKPLSKNYEDIEGLIGAAILGRGEICLIIDSQKLINSIFGNRDNIKTVQGTHKISEIENSKSIISGTNSIHSFSSAELVQNSNEENNIDKDRAEEIAKKKIKLNTEQLATLKDILRIGRKKTLLAIQKITGNKNIKIKFKATKIQSIEGLTTHINNINIDKEVHTYYMKLSGDIAGDELLIISRKNMIDLASLMYEEKFVSLNREVISAIKELANIMGVSFTNAISEITNLEVLPSPPEYIPDFKNIISEKINPGRGKNQSIMIETEFSLDMTDTVFYFYLLPKQSDFYRLTEK